MPTKLDLTGQPFGRLVVIERMTERDKYSQVLWLCRCDCGGTVKTTTARLRSGKTQSCGCLRRETCGEIGKAGNKRVQHGHVVGNVQSGTYRSFYAMMSRCNNKALDSYQFYGGAGVTVCEGLNTFEKFLAVMGERPANTTLGRRADLGGYLCGNCFSCRVAGARKNCAWQTHKQQLAARRKKTALRRKVTR